MTYATLDDLTKRFGTTELVLLTDDADSGVVDQDIVATILGDVDAMIDSYLTDRYQLPLTAVPPALVPIACDLARYGLATRNGNARATEQMTERNDNALRWLRDVATGKIGLGQLAPGNVLLDTGGSRATPIDRVFTKETLRDFRPVNRRRRGWFFW